MSKKFQRTRENFTCAKCGFGVKGSGYTNHCPYCLWSRHVDVNPGDRQATCSGLMEPVVVELKGRERVIVHRCLKCGLKKRNRFSAGDNLRVML